jgi:thioredoxin-related protein
MPVVWWRKSSPDRLVLTLERVAAVNRTIIAVVVGIAILAAIHLANLPATSSAPGPVEPSPATPSPATPKRPRLRLTVYTEDGCSWCRKLEAEMKTSQVKTALERYDLAEVNDVIAAEAAGVRSYPTLIVTDPNNSDEVRRHSGYMPAAALATWLSEVKDVSYYEPSSQAAILGRRIESRVKLICAEGFAVGFLWASAVWFLGIEIWVIFFKRGHKP